MALPTCFGHGGRDGSGAGGGGGDGDGDGSGGSGHGDKSGTNVIADIAEEDDDDDVEEEDEEDEEDEEVSLPPCYGVGSSTMLKRHCSHAFIAHAAACSPQCCTHLHQAAHTALCQQVQLTMTVLSTVRHHYQKSLQEDEDGVEEEEEQDEEEVAEKRSRSRRKAEVVEEDDDDMEFDDDDVDLAEDQFKCSTVVAEGLPKGVGIPTEVSLPCCPMLILAPTYLSALGVADSSMYYGFPGLTLVLVEL